MPILFVEPPGPELPVRSILNDLGPRAIYLALAAATVVLGVSSRGDALVLASVLAGVVGLRVAASAVVLAVIASSWRWGSTSLEALSGAQAVLGPAGGVGPATAALGSWLAGVAILFALARPTEVEGWFGAVEVARAAAAGVAVSAVLAGPAPGGDLLARAVVGLGVSAAAVGLAMVRNGRTFLHPAIDGLSLAAGLGGVVSVSRSAPSWPPSIERVAVGEGVVIALATAGLVLVSLACGTATSLPRDARAWFARRRLNPASGAPGDRLR